MHIIKNPMKSIQPVQNYSPNATMLQHPNATTMHLHHTQRAHTYQNQAIRSK